MANPFEMSIHFNQGYVPTQIQAGQVTESAFRSKNMWFRKDGRNENFRGISDIGENVPLLPVRGQWTFTAGSPEIYGDTAARAKSDVVRCSFVISNGLLFTVREIYADNHLLVDPAPTDDYTGNLDIGPILTAFEDQRAVFFGGSVTPYRGGAIACVGFGPLYLNGDYKTTLKKRLQIGIHGVGPGGGFGFFNAGLPDAPVPTVALGTGGTKNMIEGNNSIVIARGRTGTQHYANASDPAVVSNPGDGTTIVTLPALDTGNGQNIWRIYGSEQGMTKQVTDDLARNGPWYRLDDQVGPGPYTYEWTNSELPGDTPAYFDHDPPPDASYLTTLGDVLLLHGCHGPDPNNPLGSTTPGPAIRASLPGDPESFPPRAVEYVNPHERIVGAVSALGRSFVMTDNRLQLIIPTGVDEKPIVSRPLWDTGFKHQQSAVIVNDRIYGFSGGGGFGGTSDVNDLSGRGGRPSRSNPNASDEAQDFLFSQQVQDVTSTWVASRVIVAHDPKNRCVIFIHNNDHKNAQGWWVSVALAFMLETETWSGLFEMSSLIASTTGNFLITGAAACAGQLFLLLNDSAGALTWKTYVWDAGQVPIPWYLGTSFLDAEAPGQYKTVRKVEVIGRTMSGRVMLFRDNNLDGLENGTGPPTGYRDLVSTTQYGANVAVNPWWKTNLRLAKTLAIRVEGVWPGLVDGVYAPTCNVDEIAIKGTLREVYH
jgi:hypothetical protein